MSARVRAGVLAGGGGGGGRAAFLLDWESPTEGWFSGPGAPTTEGLVHTAGLWLRSPEHCSHKTTTSAGTEPVDQDSPSSLFHTWQNAPTLPN